LTDSYTLSRVIRATPKRLFESWLDSDEHSSITGRAATVDPADGGGIDLLDGLITGTNARIEPYHRIVQAWTMEAFSSRVEIVLSTLMGQGAIANAHDDGATITVTHSELPTGQSLFNPEWWEQTYFSGMDAYFARNRNGFMHPAHQTEATQNG
jgi:activator of HSP90 ATPase